MTKTLTETERFDKQAQLILDKISEIVGQEEDPAIKNQDLERFKRRLEEEGINI